MHRFCGYFGTPAFRNSDRNLYRLLRMSLVEHDDTNTLASERIYILFCQDCTYSIVVSSCSPSSDIADVFMANPGFPLYEHCNVTGHSTTLKVLQLNTPDDVSIDILLELYRLLYNASGFRCTTLKILSNIPRALKRFISNLDSPQHRIEYGLPFNALRRIPCGSRQAASTVQRKLMPCGSCQAASNVHRKLMPSQALMNHPDASVKPLSRKRRRARVNKGGRSKYNKRSRIHTPK